MGTKIDHYPSLRDGAVNIPIDSDAGIGRIWCRDAEGEVVCATVSEMPKAHSKPIKECIKDMGLRPILSKLDEASEKDLYDWTCRTHEAIFRYFFRYPSAQRGLVHSFCAAVRDDWSSTVRGGGVPSEWNEQQSDSGEYLLEYDATLAEAVQYGREEPIAQQVDDFAEVDFAKTMSPAIDWGGMKLTDPTDGTKKLFEPGQLHLTDDTSLQDQIHTQVSRSDLISHWGLTFS